MPPTAGPFITPALFRFLRELERHNERVWFEANKQRYLEVVRDPLLAFIATLAPKLHKISPSALADPRPVGGSLFRIHRDTRFGKDKRPYKTQAAMAFRLADKDTPAPAYYLQLDKNGTFAGAGVWHPQREALLAIRTFIAEHPARWKKVAKLGLNEDGGALKRAPRGFDPDHPLIEDIKRKNFATSATFSEQEACAGDFPTRLLREFRRSKPLVEALSVAVGLEG